VWVCVMDLTCGALDIAGWHLLKINKNKKMRRHPKKNEMKRPRVCVCVSVCVCVCVCVFVKGGAGGVMDLNRGVVALACLHLYANKKKCNHHHLKSNFSIGTTHDESRPSLIGGLKRKRQRGKERETE